MERCLIWAWDYVFAGSGQTGRERGSGGKECGQTQRGRGIHRTAWPRSTVRLAASREKLGGNFRRPYRVFEVAEVNAREVVYCLGVCASKMTSRREFFQLATRTAAAAMLASSHGAATEQRDTRRATPRRGLPLLELQQRFVDLRFGMFVHFNMATFQDREWGDPRSPADLFRPTALDTDQWAAAAQSANMTWGCLTTS